MAMLKNSALYKSKIQEHPILHYTVKLV